VAVAAKLVTFPAESRAAKAPWQRAGSAFENGLSDGSGR
jgi:hypothetical protein